MVLERNVSEDDEDSSDCIPYLSLNHTALGEAVGELTANWDV